MRVFRLGTLEDIPFYYIIKQEKKIIKYEKESDLTKND